MPDFEPRRAKPGEQFTVTGSEGRQHEFKADDEGVIQPKNQEDAGLLDTFGLPVARKAMAEAGAPNEAAKAAKGGK